LFAGRQQVSFDFPFSFFNASLSFHQFHQTVAELLRKKHFLVMSLSLACSIIHSSVLKAALNLLYTSIKLMSELCSARLMLWSQIIYGRRTASISLNIVRFYGARPAAGRIVRFFINFLDIVRCPVKFMCYLKFHGARTAFGRVNEGKMTFAGHRTVPGRRLHTSDDFCLIFISYDSNSARPGTVRCPAGHRTMSDKRQEL